jgi:hypothetical protein
MRHNAKRILSITIRRIEDTDPDTSYLGSYNDTPQPFSIDRRHSLDCQSVQPSRVPTVDRLERAIAYLDPQRIALSNAEDEGSNERYAGLVTAQDILIEAQDRVSECDCNEQGDAGRGDYRYFNPGSVEAFDAGASWIPEEITSLDERLAYWETTMRENALRDYARMERLDSGDMGYIGIRADAEVVLQSETRDGSGVVQTLTSGGLWGIETDSDASHLAEVALEEVGELRGILRAAGFGTRAISKAFKDVTTKYE